MSAVVRFHLTLPRSSAALFHFTVLNLTPTTEQSNTVSSALTPFALPFSHSHILAAQAQPSQRKPGRILVNHELDFSILHAVRAECG
jgi:hypothetical protein